MSLALAVLMTLTVPAYPEAATIKIPRPAGSGTVMSRISSHTPVAVIVMKGHWCEVCVDQLERMAKLHELLRSLKVEVVGLVAESGDIPDREILNRRKIGLNIFGAAPRALETLGFWLPKQGHPMPGIIFLDRCGRIAATYLGRRADITQERFIIQMLEHLTREKNQCGMMI